MFFLVFYVFLHTFIYLYSLSLSLCRCLCVCVCTNACAFVYVCARLSLSVCVSMYVWACTHVHPHACTLTWMLVCRGMNVELRGQFYKHWCSPSDMWVWGSNWGWQPHWQPWDISPSYGIEYFLMWTLPQDRTIHSRRIFKSYFPSWLK